MPPKMRQTHISACDEEGFFIVHGDTFPLKDGLKQRGGRGIKDDNGKFNWKFQNRAYPVVLEYLNEAKNKGMAVLGKIEEIDTEANADSGEDEEPDDSVDEGINYHKLAKTSSVNGALPQVQKTDLSSVNSHLASLLKSVAIIEKAVTSSKPSSSHDADRLQEELVATEQALANSTEELQLVRGKLEKFIKLLDSKGDDEFPASKLAENLRKI